MYQRNVVILKI